MNKNIWDMLAFGPDAQAAQQNQMLPNSPLMMRTEPQQPVLKPSTQSKFTMPTQQPTQVSVETKTRSIPPAEGVNYESEMNDMYRQGIDRQNKRLSEYEGELNDLGEKPSGFQALNLAPAMALVDSWNGTKLAQSYTAPTVVKDWEAKKRLLQSAVDKTGEGISSDQMEYLKMKAAERRAREQSEATRLMFGSRKDQATDDKIERDVQKLAIKLEPTQTIGDSISNVESMLGFKLDDYDEKTGEYLAADPKTGAKVRKKLDLPGVNIPGLGRVTAYDTNAQNLDSALSKVFNVELKDRSGGSVTDSELSRLKSEFASGRFNTEESKIKALKDYRRAAQRIMKNTEAAFRPEVKGRYQSRDGYTSEKVFRNKFQGFRVRDADGTILELPDEESYQQAIREPGVQGL